MVRELRWTEQIAHHSSFGQKDRMASPHPMLQQAIALSNAGRNAEAAAIVTRLAATGDAQALFLLGQMQWGGGIVEQDPVAARANFARAAQAGHPAARIVSTNLLASGIAGARDWAGALMRLAGEAAIDPRRKLQAELLGKMTLDTQGNPIKLRTPDILSDSPWVQRFPGLLTAAECAYLVDLAQRSFAPAQVRDAKGGMKLDPIRNSDEATLHWMIEDPVVHAINRRIAAHSGTQSDQGEALQILRYKPGQQYRAHYDFNPTLDNQRILTALTYLNHDYRGGETAFIKTGLKVRGRKGDVVLFRNTLDSTTLDPMSEHAGMPVTSGVKYLASRWIRAERMCP
jgi:prolyl 4-hydroxylase